MIDSYGERSNPCTFCAGINEAAPNKEYLEFSLCGNDTTLLVREVSVDDLKPKEGVQPTEEAGETSESLLSKRPISSQDTLQTPPKGLRNPSETRNSHVRRLDALYTKKWSGNTYFEEELRMLRDQQYNKDVKEAMRMRKLWKKFQLELLKDRRRDLLKSSGPEWWQEPSTKQIVLATTLRDVIKADYEEEVTGRTRQWLLDLGVATRLTPKQVRRCMKLSMLEPVDFLLEAHTQIVRSQQSVKKKGDLQRPFSVDERLLLTAVCVLQLPTLLTLLHYLLPPPKSYSSDKFVKELLYGDLNNEAIRYSTPYMEPLPFRNKIDFEDWAFGKICSALLPVLLKQDPARPSTSDFGERVASDLKSSLCGGSHHRPHKTLSIYSGSPSVALLLSYCLSKRKISDSLRVNVDDDSMTQRKTFGRRLTSMVKKVSQPKAVELSKGEQTELQSSVKSLESPSTMAIQENTSTPVKPKDKPSPHSVQEPVNEEYSWVNHPWQAELSQPAAGYGYAYGDPQYYGNYYDDQYNYYEETEGQRSSKEERTQSRTKTVDTVASTHSKKTLNAKPSPVIQEDTEKGFQKEQERSEALSQLEDIWGEITACPEKEQLGKALAVLMEMGEPLAQLPGIQKLPTIHRWLELRRGKNRILTKQTKLDLVNQSRGMWKSVHFNHSTRGPKVDISKAEARKLTWDKKKWLESQVKKEKQDYFTRIRQEKVDNARAFFPTMLNQYDYGSQLNRNFRDVYFTYMPAREADTFAYRPWKPSETINARK